MSRRKIRLIKKKQPAKLKEGASLVDQLEGKTISTKQVEMKKLTDKRLKKRREDADIIYTMAQAKKIDMNRLLDHKYQIELAKELGWSRGRLKKAFKMFGARL